jgi:hypothetical protein
MKKQKVHIRSGQFTYFAFYMLPKYQNYEGSHAIHGTSAPIDSHQVGSLKEQGEDSGNLTKITV